MRSKNKVLFLTNDFPPAEGGMETCAFEISSELQKRGYDLKIITSATKCKSDINSSNPQRISPPRNYFIKILFIFFYLLKASIKFKQDFIYLNTWSPFGLPAVIISKIFKSPLYLTCHGLDIVEPRKSAFHMRIMRFVFKSAAKIICVSNYTGNLAKENIPEISDKIRIINNGVNINKFKPLDSADARNRLKIDQNAFILLTVSRITPRKGHIHIINNLQKLIETIPEIKYVIAGRGVTDEILKKEVFEKKLESEVLFTGFVKDEELIYYYNACDLFIMLSEEIIETGDIEGFGVSYLEANACGKPAIALNRAGAADAVITGVNGYLINNPSDFTDIVLRLHSSRNELTDIGFKSLDYARKKCSWQNRVDEYIKVFSE